MSTTTPTVPTWAPPRWANAAVATMLRTPGLQRVLGRAFALITVTGRRSGRAITTPVSYDRQGDTVLVITKVVRTWWRNLLDRPEVDVRLAGRDHRGRAQLAVGDPAGLPDLLAFLSRHRADARAYGVGFTDDGRPDPDQAAAVLPQLVIIHITLEDPSG